MLASASPRRAELLTAAGFAFDVDPVDVDESRLHGEPPTTYVDRVARLKASTSARRHPQRIVVAADTVVVLGDSVLGKPRDELDAREMLGQLSGRSHEVMTGIAVAAAGLSHTGEHQIVGMAHRGSGADYLVDEAKHHLEVAGRSRRVDLAAAWENKWKRLRDQNWGECYVGVSEFETLTGRLEFALLPGETNDGNGDVPG